MNVISIMQNLYLFLVALVITVGILMIILFFSLFNRDSDSTSYEHPVNEEIEFIPKDKQP
ncbi:MAG: hypothetical protein ACRCXZ_03525 [Patescibacteria group bacterium]